MQTSAPLPSGLPTRPPNPKGKGMQIIEIATVMKNTEQPGSLSGAREEYSTLEHVPEIDLSLLADEDLSGDWWKRYDPPKELIWTEEDRCRWRRMAFGDCFERLEGVLEQLQNGAAVAGPTDLPIEVAVQGQRFDNSHIAPEVLPSPQEGSRYRPRLSVSSALSDTRGAVELDSPTSPGSATDNRSISGSLYSSGSKKSKQRPASKREFIMPGAYIYSQYYSPLPPNDRAVATLPTSPRAEQIKRFWSKRSGESECSSCMDGHKNRKLVTLACQHKYCHGCLETMIKTAIQDETHWPPRCCIQDIPLKVIKSTLSKKDQQAFHDKAREYATPVADRVYCPQPSCSAWIPPTNAKRITCPQCGFAVCKTCRGPAHSAQEDCPEDFGLQVTLEDGWRRCPQCRALVERVSGGNHMTCKCNAEFCYICGGVWRTCTCRPDEEEVEVRAAVAAVEAMNRQEEVWNRREGAIKAAQARREQMEAEWSAQVAEQEREMQEMWLRTVKERYDHLRQELDSLYRRQWKVLNERHWHEREQLETERLIYERESKKKIATDMELLGERRGRELQEQRILLEQEREKLSNEQAAEEDEYWFSLQSYLKGRPNKEERQRTLMDKFNASQVERMNALHQQQQQRLTDINTRLETQLANLEYSMNKAREVKLEAAATGVKDKTRHQYADTKWFEAVRVARHDELMSLEEATKTNENVKRNVFSEWHREPVELDDGD